MKQPLCFISLLIIFIVLGQVRKYGFLDLELPCGKKTGINPFGTRYTNKQRWWGVSFESVNNYKCMQIICTSYSNCWSYIYCLMDVCCEDVAKNVSHCKPGSWKRPWPTCTLPSLLKQHSNNWRCNPLWFQTPKLSFFISSRSFKELRSTTYAGCWWQILLFWCLDPTKS